jgi:hypothetical protein
MRTRERLLKIRGRRDLTRGWALRSILKANHVETKETSRQLSELSSVVEAATHLLVQCGCNHSCLDVASMRVCLWFARAVALVRPNVMRDGTVFKPTGNKNESAQQGQYFNTLASEEQKYKRKYTDGTTNYMHSG